MLDNSVVGAGILVNKRIESSNVILADTPAKIIKENINWDRKAPNAFTDK